MAIPFLKEIRIGTYIMRQRLMGRKRYPLVLMLEPLFRCNLECVGCGKIDYPDPISRSRFEFELFLAPTTRITSTRLLSSRTAVCRFCVA